MIKKISISLYFRNELAKICKDNSNIKTINLKCTSIEQFEVIIKYIYGGVILLENQDTSFIFDLLIMANEFLLEELTTFLEKHLIEEKSHWLRLHFTKIYQKSFQNNQFQNLQKWCNNFLVKYPAKIFDSEEFTSLQENALVSLRDDLQMEELKIWNYVIKWGIAQNPNLQSSGPEDLTPENFQTLKTTLQNCLPHIRYFRDDIVDKIEPYQAILERDLWKDIMKRITNPNREISSKILPPRIILKPKLPTRAMESFSTVINEEHAAEIASWIDKKANPYSIEDNPYEFKLLLRGTRDGFTPDTFWKLCDKQENTIVVVKVNNTDEILGGYNPTQWDKSKKGYWTKCDDSFIFSLKNGSILSSILSRVKNTEYAIYNTPSSGPCFGAFYAEGDLRMLQNITYCRKYAYEIAIRNTKNSFSVSEYEIFQIQKKN
ncbi:hypothetical protein C2G38_2284120 [Gigaspora rosea]|uniref:TLDc domain-containing protein n=1 Tax=Gigaspora rosea TaxID=44941 RepID=A0A397VSS2_9GLOM|nr:hypothetical protein C2G38_2284120 [Gigaspora rosea]